MLKASATAILPEENRAATMSECLCELCYFVPLYSFDMRDGEPVPVQVRYRREQERYKHQCGVAQLAERRPVKAMVEGSCPSSAEDL